MYNLALIGCGRISYKHIQAIISNQLSIKLVAICDIIIDKAEEKANQYETLTNNNYKPKIYKNYKEMLENEDIDIVSICTESGYHSKQAIYCMNKGKHVIVEKPIALSIQDADKMIKVAKVKNVKLCVSHQNRFNPVIQLLWNAIEQERFGKLIGGNARILWSRSQDYYKQASWRGTYELDGGCLMNQCIHNIDLLQWMMGGKIRWVSGAVNNYSHPNIEVEDYGSIQMEFENGAIGNVEGTVCVTGGNLEETLTIIGEKGFVSIGGVAVNKIESWRFDDGLDKEENIMAEFNQEVESIYGEGHSMLYKNFVESIENNIEPYINGEEAIASMQIILASYKSNQEGRRIIFPVNNISTKDFRLKNNNKSL